MTDSGTFDSVDKMLVILFWLLVMFAMVMAAYENNRPRD